jgi:hypothetical protein
MFAFALGVIFCDGGQDGVARPQELANVLVQELEFLCYNLERVDGDVTGRGTGGGEDFGDGILDLGNGGRPC